MKIPKKCNKFKGRLITCSHIWLYDISKYVYWLHTHSAKNWLANVLPNANAAHFLDIWHCFHPGNKKTVLEIKNPSYRESNRIIYRTFSRYIPWLYISWCRLQILIRQRQTNRIPKLPTDRHFLFLSDSCLYLGPGSFFLK